MQPDPVQPASGQAHEAPRAGMPALLAAAFAGLVALAVPPLALFILVALVPTLVAWIVEKPEQKNLCKCVGLLNVSGVLTVGYHYAGLGFTMPGLAKVLSEASLWAALYGPASIGWGLCLTVPPLIQTMARAKLDRRRRLLEIGQKQIVREWGPEAASKEPPA